MRLATRAIHAGQPPDPTTGATVPPIYQTSTYTQRGLGDHLGYEYSQTGNPTRTALEECLASLEQGEHALAFASGLAAIDAVLAQLSSGDHVVSVADVYGGTYRLFERVYRDRGLSFSYWDGAIDTLPELLQPGTRLLWLESPTNPLLQLVDIAAASRLAREHGALTAVDNTFASPALQQPLLLGADLVVHSTTKYLGGHSDVIGGAVILNDESLYESLKFHQNAAGAVPAPFDAWLTLRGIKTLAIRMQAHEANALAVAEYLAAQPQVKRVIYPGRPDHPQHELAKRQMSGFGGMVSFELDGGREQVDRFVRALSIFSFAESLGGVESLACYPPEMTHASFPPDERERRGITAGLLRLSVGIEDQQDLLDDLENALAASS
jgi:cystathionine beta-lyase/cystathionine gamma-synthase